VTKAGAELDESIVQEVSGAEPAMHHCIATVIIEAARSSLLNRFSVEIVLFTVHSSGSSVAEWLACWTQAQKDLGSNRNRHAVG